MSILRKSAITVQPSGVDQRTEGTQLPIGRMRELHNVRQIEPGLYGKAYGFDWLDRNTRSASLSAGQAMHSNGEVLTVQDNGSVYERNDVVPVWENQATPSPFVARRPPEVLPFGYRPSSVRAGDLIYYFGCDYLEYPGTAIDEEVGDGIQNSGTDIETWWYFRIVDALTGVEIVPPTKINDCQADTSTCAYGKPIFDGQFVWFFVGAGESRYIYVTKFDPLATVGGPTIAATVYYDSGVASELVAWDVMLDLDNTVVFVGYGVDLDADSGTDPGNCVFSRLDPANSVPSAVGTVGVVAESAIITPCCVNWIKNAVGADTFLYCLTTGGTLTGTKVLQVDTAALTLASTIVLGAHPAATIVSGYFEDSKFTTFSTKPGSTPEKAALDCNTFSDIGVIDANLAVKKYGLVLTSDPIKFRDVWYVLACHDDNTTNLQRGYYLLDNALTIIGRTLHGEGGSATQVTFTNQGSVDTQCFVSQRPRSDGTTYLAAVLNAFEGARYVSRELMLVRDVTRPIPQVGQTLLPSAWPLFGGDLETTVVMSPRLAPGFAGFLGDAGGMLPAGDYKSCYLWARRDSVTGEIHRSEASAIATTTLMATNYLGWTDIRPLWLVNNPDEWFIEIYMSEADTDTLYLQFTIPNTDSVDAIAFETYQTTVDTRETLYTQGGAALPNEPPPAFRSAGIFGRYMLLFDLDVEGVAVSTEKETGFPYQFSSDLVFVLPGGTGRSCCGAALDDNRFVIFEEKGAWLIGGAGPDRLGNGLWEPQPLKSIGGCINPRSLLTTRHGIIYQDAGDDGIYLIRLDTTRTYLGAGVEDYRGADIVGSVYDPAQDRVVLFIGDESTLNPAVPTTSKVMIADVRSAVNGIWRTVIVLDSIEGVNGVWDIDPTQYPGTQMRITLTAGFKSDGVAIQNYKWRVRYGAAYDAFADDPTPANATEVLAITHTSPNTGEYQTATGTISKPSSPTSQIILTHQQLTGAVYGTEIAIGSFSMLVEFI